MKNIASIVCSVLTVLFFSQAALALSDRERLIERGKNAYRIYCWNCHGKEANGKGPAAQLLTIQPSDLRLIKKEGEDFPYDRIHRTIDGRKLVKGHGGRDMPIWGDAFGGRRAILVNELIHFLETIQKNP